MSEFKFACPVCGQHITGDSAAAGGQIECPTCFQKIVVPQAPKAGDTTLVLSAARVAKPRPASANAASGLGPMRRASSGPSLLAVAVLLVLLCVAAAVILHFRDPIAKALRALAPAGTNALASRAAAPLPLNTNYPIPTNITWTLNPTNTVYPGTAAAGRIHGSGFRCEKAVLWGGLLTLDQGEAWPWDLGLALHLFARRGEELSDKTVEIPPDRPRAPRVVLRWKDAHQQPLTETFNSGYLLKVAFGHATNAHIPGQIYICLPDGDQSFVAGTFEAEIRNVWPPKHPPPKPPGTNGEPPS